MESREQWQDAPSEPWRLLAERKIDEWMEQGKFKNLEGEGKPLELEDNPFLKAELRLSYKILKDAGFAPPWIELGKEIDGDQDSCRLYHDRCEEWARREARKLNGKPSYVVDSQTRYINAEIQGFLREYARRLEEINQKIDKFNLSVPVFGLARARINVQAAVEAARDDVMRQLNNPA